MPLHFGWHTILNVLFSISTTIDKFSYENKIKENNIPDL